MKVRVFGVMMAAGLLLAACDDKPSVPQAVLEQVNKQNASKTPKQPTTQELVSGRRTQLALLPLPLTMQVPPSWKIEALPGTSVQLLTGPTPGGDVQIQLTGRPSVKTEDLQRLVSAAKKEMSQKPQTIKKVELRSSGEVKILDQERVGSPAPLTTFDANNVPHTQVVSSYTWTISVYVPVEGAYQVYELNFIGLTSDQYAVDKDFLNGIINTVSYAIGGAASPATPALPAAPAPPPTPAPAALPATP